METMEKKYGNMEEYEKTRALSVLEKVRGGDKKCTQLGPAGPSCERKLPCIFGIYSFVLRHHVKDAKAFDSTAVTQRRRHFIDESGSRSSYSCCLHAALG